MGHPRADCPCMLYLVWPQHFCVSRARRGHKLGALPAEYQFPGNLRVGKRGETSGEEAGAQALEEGQSYLIGCWVSQSPAPETWSLFDFELLMELSKVK